MPRGGLVRLSRLPTMLLGPNNLSGLERPCAAAAIRPGVPRQCSNEKVHCLGWNSPPRYCRFSRDDDSLFEYITCENFRAQRATSFPDYGTVAPSAMVSVTLRVFQHEY